MRLSSVGCQLEKDGTWTTKVVYIEPQGRGGNILHVYKTSAESFEEAMRFLRTIGANMEVDDGKTLQT